VQVSDIPDEQTKAEMAARIEALIQEHQQAVIDHKRQQAKREREIQQARLKANMDVQSAVIAAQTAMIQGVAEHLKKGNEQQVDVLYEMKSVYPTHVLEVPYVTVEEMDPRLLDGYRYDQAGEAVSKIIAKAQNSRRSLWRRLLTAINNWVK
jgi:vacuolar-type H+-ATPase subunit D/Vma8